MAKRNALGRGLGALLENYDTDVTTRSTTDQAENVGVEGGALVGTVANLSLESIVANPFQPRTEFDEEALEELAASIKQFNIIQPVTVRKMGYDQYQLISGERRYKAAQMAGLSQIPAYIRIAKDQEMLELALVENIQRRDLNALEISISYNRLIEECSLTQEELSQRIGKNRTTVANYLRLLKLPDIIQAGIKENKIQMGHARALINVEDQALQLVIYKKVLAKSLSVRQVEDLVRKGTETNRGEKSEDGSTKKTSFLTNEQKKMVYQLSTYFDTEVEIRRNRNKSGKIIIPFDSDEELARLARAID